MIQITTGQHTAQIPIDINGVERVLAQIKMKEDFRIFIDTLEYFNGVREEVEEDCLVLIVNIDRDQYDRSDDKQGLFLRKLAKALQWTELVDGVAIAERVKKESTG